MSRTLKQPSINTGSPINRSSTFSSSSHIAKLLMISVLCLQALVYLTYYLPFGSREWKNGSNCSYNCSPAPFLHSLLTKGKTKAPLFPQGFHSIRGSFLARSPEAENIMLISHQCSLCRVFWGLGFMVSIELMSNAFPQDIP